MLRGLDGKVAVITGAAGNIGVASVDRLVAEGATVVAADLDPTAVAAVVARHPGRVVGVAADVTTGAGVDACIAAADSVGGLDLAFVNAGVECVAASVADFDPNDYERVFAVNVKGAFLTAQAAVRSLRSADKPGGILLTASIAGLQGGARTSVYNASKHAVVGLGKSLAAEVGPLGIRVNILCPGPVDSRMMRSLEKSIGVAAGVSAGAVRSGIERRIGLGRYTSPEEIAATAAWILSDEVASCHGEVFTVGGGLAG